MIFTQTSVAFGQSKLPSDFSKRLGQLVNNPQMADSAMVIDSITGKAGKICVKIDSSYFKGIVHDLFIIRQDYSLYNKKNKLYYGYNDQDQFGTTYSLGVKCNTFSLLLDEAVHPWNYDSKYDSFKDKKLEPKITKTEILLLDDSLSYRFTELDSIFEGKKTIKDNCLYSERPLTSTQDGISINTSDTCKAGVLIWITEKSGSFENGDIKVEFKYVVQNVEMFGNVIVSPPADCKKILGCLFMTESGNKENPYLLSGIAALQHQQWTLYFPFKDLKNDFIKEEEKPKEKGKLTVIKRPNKEK